MSLSHFPDLVALLVRTTLESRHSCRRCLSSFRARSLPLRHFFDESSPIRIAVKFEDISPGDLARLASEHRTRVAGIVKDGNLTLVRKYSTDGKSTLCYCTPAPKDARFSLDSISALVKSQRAGQAFVRKVIDVFPELEGKVGVDMNQDEIKQKIRELADSLPDGQKILSDQPLPTGIDTSIAPMLPDPIYIPAVKDLADDIKTTESTPFGRILTILLPAVEAKLPEAHELFKQLDSKLNRMQQGDGTFVDDRIEEIKVIEATVERYVRESFADIALRIHIPPPELKTIFSAAKIYVNDGVEGLIDTKGDGLRRALVFSILRSYVQLKLRLTPDSELPVPSGVETQSEVQPAPLSYILLFEEPELFLHPKGQHILFDALGEFAKDHHVLVSTHSPMFFGPGTTGTFIKLRRTTDYAVAPKPFTHPLPIDLSNMSSKDQFQIICFENNTAAFFADTVVLVEGDSDYLLLPHIAKGIDPSWDIARKSLHFARITGKGNIRRYRDFFARFGVRVPVIADLDFLLTGFDHISPDRPLQIARNDLLRHVDELVVLDGAEPTAKEAKEAHGSGDLRSLWSRVKQRRRDLAAGCCTQAEHDLAVEEFFAWERKSERLDVLKNSGDTQLLQLKWRLLDLLRQSDVFLLERGAIEQYYPDTITGADKPSKAEDFCMKVATREAILGCCGEQEVEREGRVVREKEFLLVFKDIFGS